MKVEVELIKQKIHSNIEQRKMYWTIELILAGGIATLLTSLDSYVKIGLLVVGIILFIFIIKLIRYTNKSLKILFDKMEGLIK